MAGKTKLDLTATVLSDPALSGGTPPWRSILRDIDPEAEAALAPGGLPDVETLKRVVAEHVRRNRAAGALSETLAVKLNTETLAALDKAADRRGVSRADLVRSAIAALLAEDEAHIVDDYLAEQRQDHGGGTPPRRGREPRPGQASAPKTGGKGRAPHS